MYVHVCICMQMHIYLHDPKHTDTFSCGKSCALDLRSASKDTHVHFALDIQV